MHVSDGRFSIDFVDVENVRSSAICANCIGEIDVSMRVGSKGAKSEEGGLHCRLRGTSMSSIGPYCPKISRRCSSVTFFVKRSTTICSSV